MKKLYAALNSTALRRISDLVEAMDSSARQKFLSMRTPQLALLLIQGIEGAFDARTAGGAQHMLVSVMLLIESDEGLEDEFRETMHMLTEDTPWILGEVADLQLSRDAYYSETERIASVCLPGFAASIDNAKNEYTAEEVAIIRRSTFLILEFFRRAHACA